MEAAVQAPTMPPAAAPTLSEDVPAATELAGPPALAPPPLAAGIEQEAVAAEVALTSEAVTTADPPPAPAKITRIIVAEEAPAEPAADAAYASSLSAALRRAEELGVSEIELAWTGRQVEPPLDLSASRLTLRAADGHQPIVVFQPQIGLATNYQMLRLAGGSSSRLAIQGVELRLELPSDPSSYPWALVAISSGQTLEISDCVLTVQDGTSSRPAVHEQVATIAIQARRPSDTMPTREPQPSMASSTTVTLDRCIVRGEATLFVMPEETKLSVNWTQGLLATPRRLIETGGSSTNPKWFDDISLHLTRVTASCRQGLYQMKRRGGNAHQFAMNMSADQCILATDPQSPLFEFVGVTSVSESDLNCDGNGNRYPHPDVLFLRYRSGAAGETPQDYDFGQRSQWSEERSPRPGVPWQETPDWNTPAHAKTKANFLLDDSAAADAGFDPDLLPDVLPPPMASVPPAPPSPFDASPAAEAEGEDDDRADAGESPSP
jgi:hypothetical protein